MCVFVLNSLWMLLLLLMRRRRRRLLGMKALGLTALVMTRAWGGRAGTDVVCRLSVPPSEMGKQGSSGSCAVALGGWMWPSPIENHAGTMAA